VIYVRVVADNTKGMWCFGVNERDGGGGIWEENPKS
jgi:hypothetical protein